MALVLLFLVTVFGFIDFEHNGIPFDFKEGIVEGTVRLCHLWWKIRQRRIQREPSTLRWILSTLRAHHSADKQYLRSISLALKATEMATQNAAWWCAWCRKDVKASFNHCRFCGASWQQSAQQLGRLKSQRRRSRRRDWNILELYRGMVQPRQPRVGGQVPAKVTQTKASAINEVTRQNTQGEEVWEETAPKMLTIKIRIGTRTEESLQTIPQHLRREQTKQSYSSKNWQQPSKIFGPASR